MTDIEYTKWVRSEHEATMGNSKELGMSICEIVGDTATMLMEENPNVVQYLNKIGVTDVVGRIADDIAYGVSG